MSTEPVNLQYAPSKFQQDLSWIRHHAILLLIVVGLVYAGVLGVQNIIDKHDAAKDSLLHQELAALQQQGQDLKAQMNNDAAANAARDARADQQLAAANAALQASQSALAALLKQNATLNAQQAAAKLSTQVNAAPGQIKAVGDSVVADLPTAIKFVDGFDKLSAAQADLASTHDQLTATNVKLEDANKNLGDAKAVIENDEKEKVKAVETCKQDIKTAVDGEKKKHKWYAVAGAVIAVLFRQAVSSYRTL